MPLTEGELCLDEGGRTTCWKEHGFWVREMVSGFSYTNCKLAASSRQLDAQLVHDRPGSPYISSLPIQHK